MLLKNTDERYGLVAIVLHWIMAILIIGLLALGLYMVRQPLSFEKLKLYGWHKEYGLLVLALVIVRISWRIMNKTPKLNIPWWEIVAARTVHWAFYAFMFAMPITGWLMSSAAGLPVSFFGLFTLPDLIPANEDSRLFLTTIHEWLGYALIATVCGHMAAALKHHFINKDDILRRMIS
jgi:cytochrome b561